MLSLPIGIEYYLIPSIVYILLTKTTAVQNEVALSYHICAGYFFGSCFCGKYISIGQIFFMVTFTSSLTQ